MIHQFNHRFGTYAGQTQEGANQGKLPELDDDDALTDPHKVSEARYYVNRSEVDERISGRWSREWLLGWRNITNTTNARTVIAAVLPRVAVGHSMPLLFSDQPPARVAMLYANLCSFVLDYAARQKVGGTHLKYHTFKQLPILPPDTYDRPCPWSPGERLEDWLLPRVLELTVTAWDLVPFARDCAGVEAPYRWDRARREQLRAELDAAFFHLYGLTRADVAWVLESFPIVRKNDERQHGRAVTFERVLDEFDAMATAIRRGVAFASPLRPAAGDASMRHRP